MFNFKKCFSLLLCFQLCTLSVRASALEPAKGELNLQEVALPSDVKEIGKQSGSVYYSNPVKNKVLIPAHIWGEVNKPGLHFIPADTSLIKGLSMAGGPNGTAQLDDVVLSRANKDGTFEQYEFNLSKGGDARSYQFIIESGDSIFVKKETFYENRAYYTSLIGITISILSTMLLFNRIKVAR